MRVEITNTRLKNHERNVEAFIGSRTNYSNTDIKNCTKGLMTEIQQCKGKGINIYSYCAHVDQTPSDCILKQNCTIDDYLASSVFLNMINDIKKYIVYNESVNQLVQTGVLHPKGERRLPSNPEFVFQNYGGSCSGHILVSLGLAYHSEYDI